MKPRSQVEWEINQPGLTGPTIPNADRLILELLLDIRDLLVDLYNQKDGAALIDYDNEK